MEAIVIEKIGKVDYDFDGIKWAIQAVSSDPLRKALTHALVENQILVGCDGHRLHMFEPARYIPDGLYKVTKNNKTMIILTPSDIPEKYPDYGRVFPNHQTMENGIPDCYFAFPTENENQREIANHVFRNTKVNYDINLLFEFCPRNQKLSFRQNKEQYLRGCQGTLVMWNKDLTMCGVLMSLYNR